MLRLANVKKPDCELAAGPFHLASPKVATFRHYLVVIVVVIVIDVVVFPNRRCADDVVLTVAVILIIVEIATDNRAFVSSLKASINIALLHGTER